MTYEKGFKDGIEAAKLEIKKEFAKCTCDQCRNYPLLCGRILNRIANMVQSWEVGLKAMKGM